MSLFIAENADKDKKANAAIFREFIQRFRTIIDNQNSRHNELSVAIKGYGYFAAVSTSCRRENFALEGWGGGGGR